MAESDPVALGVKIPAERLDTVTTREIIRWQGAYSLGGLVCGIAAVLFGAWLVTKDLSAQTTIGIKGKEYSLEFASSVPGIAVGILGILVIWCSRFSVTSVRSKIEK